MNSVKNFLFSVLLVSTLAFNTMAGETQLPGYIPPPPPPATAKADDPVVSVTDTETQQNVVETSDYLLYEALAALLSAY